MSKSDSRSPSASHDDVASLFARLGGRDGDNGYRDFSESRLKQPAPAAPVAPPPLPQARVEAPAVAEAPVAAAPAAAQDVPAPVKASVVRIEPAKDAPGKPAAKTSLERLFQRLAEAPLPADGDQGGPLRRLRRP